VVIFIAMPTDEQIMQTYEETGSIVETARALQMNMRILLRRIKQIQQENQPA
jgi:ActR/RegA family two-component response regulator